MTHIIIPREDIGVPTPPSTRAKLKAPVTSVLIHYTGAGTYNDPTKDWTYAESVARYGKANGKTWEYNYLIGLGGTIFEQAGEYQGAHCAVPDVPNNKGNMNPISIGVLMMLSPGVEPTEAMCESFRWLRDKVVELHLLAPTHEVVPHYHYRSTQCPGATLAALPGAPWPSPTTEGRVGDVISELLVPYEPDPVPVPIPIQEDQDMPLCFIVQNAEAPTGSPEFLAVIDGDAQIGIGFSSQADKDAIVAATGAKTAPLTNTGYQRLLKMVGGGSALK